MGWPYNDLTDVSWSRIVDILCLYKFVEGGFGFRCVLIVSLEEREVEVLRRVYPSLSSSYPSQGGFIASKLECGYTASVYIHPVLLFLFERFVLIIYSWAQF